MKVTSVNQPQSSCPFKHARQKIYGLGYSLLIFVYEKTDYAKTRTARLDIQHTIFIDKERTADYQMTRARDATVEDLVAFLSDKMLPAMKSKCNVSRPV